MKTKIKTIIKLSVACLGLLSLYEAVEACVVSGASPNGYDNQVVISRCSIPGCTGSYTTEVKQVSSPCGSASSGSTGSTTDTHQRDIADTTQPCILRHGVCTYGEQTTNHRNDGTYTVCKAAGSPCPPSPSPTVNPGT